MVLYQDLHAPNKSVFTIPEEKIARKYIYNTQSTFKNRVVQLKKHTHKAHLGVCK